MATGAPTGELVYVDREGSLIALELAGGAPKQFPLVDALAAELALDTSGTRLAFVALPKDAGVPQLTVLDLTSGARYAIDSQGAGYVGGPHWGGSGTLIFGTYATRQGGNGKIFAVPEGAKSGQAVARAEWLKAAGQGVGVAYATCIDPKKESWQCEQRLIVDAAAGGAQRVLAQKGRFRPFAFTPDGAFLLTMDRVGDAHRLMRYAVDGDERGEPLDLGAIDPPSTPVVYGAWVSPDSKEALVRRGDALLAVKVDGSGERTIASGDIESAGFVSQRGVLYAQRKNLAHPSNDVPEYVHALWYAEDERRSQVADFANCSWPSVSRSARLVARACHDGIHIHSIETGKELRSIPRIDGVLWPTLLGFDGREVGLVAAYGPDSALPQADHVLRFHGLDGRDRELGTAYTHPAPDDGVGWPSFAFVPGDG